VAPSVTDYLCYLAFKKGQNKPYQDSVGLALESDCGRALLDCLHGIFDLVAMLQNFFLLRH